MKEYNIYIDESGDEGINRGSNYFILTALIVQKEKDLEISKSVDIIKKNLNLDTKKQLHWNKIKGYQNKVMIMEIIKSLDIKLINIIIDTRKIKFLKSLDIYNFFAGYLFERIGWFMKTKCSVANIFISSRGSLEKEKLIKFLEDKNNSKFNINYKKINDIKIMPNKRKRLLQLADCCTSSLGQALKYKNEIHLSYLLNIKNKIYSYKGKKLGYGLKYIPTDTLYGEEFLILINYLKIQN